MRVTGAVVGLVVLAVACNGPSGVPDGQGPEDGSVVGDIDASVPSDASPADARPTDAGEPALDASPPCAIAQTEGWTGTARIREAGAGLSSDVDADVHWTLAATDGCVDTFVPSGTAHAAYGTLACGSALTVAPATHAIAADDGELVIDRSTSPATYQILGDTRWVATIACEDQQPESRTVGGIWAEQTGFFDGVVLSGGLLSDWASPESDWRFTRDDTTFPPLAPCSVPAVDAWTGTAEAYLTHAELSWTHVATSGCVDRFTPAGTATARPFSTDFCDFTFAPPSSDIHADHGTLTIDRSTNPPTFVIDGHTTWVGAWHCHRPDGTVIILEPETIGDRWGLFEGAFSGTTFGATMTHGGRYYSWSLGH